MNVTACFGPTGNHFWSIPQPSGEQSCLWCGATQNIRPPVIDGATTDSAMQQGGGGGGDHG